MDKSSSESTPTVETTNSPSGKKVAAAKTKSKSKVRRPTTSHPPTSEMVMSAIKDLKDRKGSSLQAIKKYIVATYKVDGDKSAPFIKRYLKSAVTSGEVVQTKGKGASGSFKLPGAKAASEAKPKAPKSPKAATATKSSRVAAQKSPKKVKAERSAKVAAKKPKTTVAEKTETKKKAVKATAIAIKPKAARAAKEKPSPARAASKTKKTAKAPAAKTRTPKPKRSSTPARAAAKK